MAWFLKALVYWGHDLESDITRSAISHVIDNQNDDGSWGDTKGTKGNAIHTTRMLAGITHIKLPGSKQVPSSTRAIVVSLTDAVNHPIKLTEPSLGVVS